MSSLAASETNPLVKFHPVSETTTLSETLGLPSLTLLFSILIKLQIFSSKSKLSKHKNYEFIYVINDTFF